MHNLQSFCKSACCTLPALVFRSFENKVPTFDILYFTRDFDPALTFEYIWCHGTELKLILQGFENEVLELDAVTHTCNWHIPLWCSCFRLCPHTTHLHKNGWGNHRIIVSKGQRLSFCSSLVEGGVILQVHDDNNLQRHTYTNLCVHKQIQTFTMEKHKNNNNKKYQMFRKK